MDGKKRKVMFLIYSLCGGGAERVLVETVNRLPKDRYDVTLMTDRKSTRLNSSHAT